MFGVSANKSIPGVEGTIDISWATSVLKTVVADSDFPMASGLEEEQAAKSATGVDESGDFGTDVRDQGDMEQGDMDQGDMDHGDMDQGDMDYEAGEWDIS
jgi:RNA-binding protein 26